MCACACLCARERRRDRDRNEENAYTSAHEKSSCVAANRRVLRVRAYMSIVVIFIIIRSTRDPPPTISGQLKYIFKKKFRFSITPPPDPPAREQTYTRSDGRCGSSGVDPRPVVGHFPPVRRVFDISRICRCLYRSRIWRASVVAKEREKTKRFETITAFDYCA